MPAPLAVPTVPPLADWRGWARVRSEGPEDDALAQVALDAAAALVLERLSPGVEPAPPDTAAALPDPVWRLAVFTVTSDLYKRRDAFAAQGGGLEGQPTFLLPLDVRRQVEAIVGPWCQGGFA